MYFETKQIDHIHKCFILHVINDTNNKKYKKHNYCQCKIISEKENHSGATWTTQSIM